MNSHPQRALCALLPSAVQQLAHGKTGTIQPKLGQQDCATRGGLTTSAAEPQIITFDHLRELIWVSLSATINCWAQGTLTPSTLLFRQIWPELPHNFGSYWAIALRETQAEHWQELHLLRLTSYKQAASLLPAVHWPPCPSCSSSPPSVPVQTLTLSRPVWEWWQARSRNRSCWKLTFFFFFFFRDYF